ncbi:hypothetical protein MJL48_16235, partial [Salmonella enterica subsp. enterica serovar Kentucky]|nr:hypothetical protein [Salmonella enterica subsp. enterica serovar Kentucky]
NKADKSSHLHVHTLPVRRVIRRIQFANKQRSRIIKNIAYQSYAPEYLSPSCCPGAQPTMKQPEG